MNIFPVVRYEIRSSAKPVDIVELLSTRVQTYPPKSPWISGLYLFTGSVSEKSFELICARRFKFSRPGFVIRPTVFGEFKFSSDLTIITITMKNDSNLYLIFLVFIFMLLTWLNLQDIVLPLFENISTINIFGMLFCFTSLLQPIGFVTLVYLGLLIGYEIEVHIAKDTLEEILAPVISK